MAVNYAWPAGLAAELGLKMQYHRQMGCQLLLHMEIEMD